VRFLFLGKFPPVEGGVSGQAFWTVRALAAQGHSVDVVTNAREVEPTLAQLHYGADRNWLDGLDAVGELRVHHTTPVGRGSFIPFAEPYASKLFGLSLSVLDRHACDVVLGWYFEPYGLVASLVGRAMGLPFVVRHAGSDLGRLALRPELRSAYRWALSRAAAVVVTNERALEERFGPVERPRVRTSRPRLPDVFHAASQPLDMRELLAAADPWFAAAGLPADVVRRIRDLNAKLVPRDVLTIGVYGKVGVTKGSFDLVAALARNANRGASFAFLSLSCGYGEILRRYYEAILRSTPLAARTWILPPVAPWRVPQFLRICDVVCFLERNFAIPFHGPLIPREVLSSGACLVCSSEIARKPIYKGNLVDDRNAVIIPDPTDHDALACRIGALIEDRTRAKAVGLQGQKLSQFWEEDLAPFDDAVRSFAAEIDSTIASR
jgi:hypothetical protein